MIDVVEIGLLEIFQLKFHVPDTLTELKQPYYAAEVWANKESNLHK